MDAKTKLCFFKVALLRHFVTGCKVTETPGQSGV